MLAASPRGVCRGVRGRPSCLDGHPHRRDDVGAADLAAPGPARAGLHLGAGAGGGSRCGLLRAVDLDVVGGVPCRCGSRPGVDHLAVRRGSQRRDRGGGRARRSRLRCAVSVAWRLPRADRARGALASVRHRRRGPAGPAACSRRTSPTVAGRDTPRYRGGAVPAAAAHRRAAAWDWVLRLLDLAGLGDRGAGGRLAGAVEHRASADRVLRSAVRGLHLRGRCARAAW